MRVSDKTFRIGVLAAFAAACFASNPGAAIEPQWADLYNGPDDLMDGGQAIAPGPDGSVYVSGFSYQWDPPHEVQSPVWVLERLDAQGQRLWLRDDLSGDIAGGPDALASDSTGALYVLGTASAFSSVQLRRVSAAGDELWMREFFPPEGRFARGESIAVGPDDSVCIAWFEYNGPDVAAVARVSAAGVVAWTKRYDGPANPGFGAAAFGSTLAVGADGALYVAGSVAVGDSDEFALWRYTTAGDFDWVETAGSAQSFADDVAVDVAIDRSTEPESIVVGGVFGYNSGLGTDLAVARYDAAGARAFLTTWRAAETSSDWMLDLEVAPSGTIYLAGVSWRGASDQLPLLAAFDAAGEPAWSRLFESPGDGAGQLSAVRTDAASRPYVAGWDFSDTVAQAYLVAGFETDGTVAWLHRYAPSPTSPSQANDLALTTDAAVVVTGKAWIEDGEGHHHQDLVTVRFPADPLFSGDFEIGSPEAWQSAQ